MNNNLLIIGAGIYSLIAAEIAEDMGVFGSIDFADDARQFSVSGKTVIGTTAQLDQLLKQYHFVVVAIGNPQVRMGLISRLEQNENCRIATLISPRAYVSPSAKIGEGCIIEPMAAVHSKCVLESGCFISAGAVVNHESKCCRGVHIDCNATVMGGSTVPQNAKVCGGEVYR